MSVLKNRCSTFVISNIRKTIQSFIVVLLLVFSNVLHAQSITELEYFFGIDPGVGNGFLVTATTNTGDFTQSIAVPLTGLSSGFHKLTFRAKDDANVWSLYHRKTFYIVEPISANPIVNLAAAEYWFGVDPGNGLAMPLAISGAPNETIENFAIPLDTLEAGFHMLSIRVKNLDDTWSLYHRKTFYIINDEINNAPSNLAAVEYWFDADPGHGNGTPITLSGTPSETVEDFAIPLGDLDVGFHSLSIRVKNLDDTWSLYHRKRFYIISPDTYGPVSPLTDAEFLYDAELGFGTGTAVAITPTGNPDEYLVEIPTDLVTCDLHDVSLSVKNALGNYSLYDITVDTDVFDNVAPTIVVFPNITVELDANGQAIPFTIADVDNGTFDDCQLVSVVLNQTQFNYTCSDLGANTVTVTATDAEDKVSTLNVTVTVVDSVNPIAITQSVTVQLDTNGNATITADDIDNNSTDNCSITNKMIDVSSFNCANLGTNTVALTVTDQSGNQSTTNAIVTVEDNVNPVAITQNIFVQLDVNGNATTTADAVDNNSIDNCSITNKTLDVSSFTCVNLGVNTVVLTVTDQSGNQNDAIATITVLDNINPVAIGKNISVDLAGNPSVTIVANEVNNGSNDNCEVANLTIDVDTFTTSGDYPVILTVTDSSGNTNDITVIVTVEDTLSIEEFNSNSLDVFPNPTQNNIHINFKRLNEYSLWVYDITGKEIINEKKLEQTNVLDFSKYATGAYILKIKELKTSSVNYVRIVKY